MDAAAAAGIVLCGGKSSRMGRPKALLPWRGRTLIEHVVAVLRPVVGELCVVSSEELELPPLDALVVRDRDPGLGPLAGLREGLDAIRAPLAFLTATDAPYLTKAFVERMLSFGGAAAAEVDGYVQPLGAVYPRAALPELEAMLRSGRLRPLHLLQALRFRRVAEAELPDTRSVRGFNTPQEYLAAARGEDPLATATLEFLGRARLEMQEAERRVPIGTLAEVLRAARPRLELVHGEAVAPGYMVCMNGRSFVRDLELPVGPGEQVIVLDAATGG